MLDEVRGVLLRYLSGAATPRDVLVAVSSPDYSESGGLTAREKDDLGLLELISLETCERERTEDDLLIAARDWLERTQSAPEWMLGAIDISRSTAENVATTWHLELPLTSGVGVSFPSDWVDEARPILSVAAETQLISR